MANTERPGGSLSGLTEGEAKEFHRIFVQSFILWVVICFFAHVLVWFWRPWFPGAESMQTSMIDGVQSLAGPLLSLVA